jgi:hypothetical protein
MNCHQRIQVKSEKVLAIRGSAGTGKAIEWVRVHRLADYVYFDHSAHIAQGVSCLSCHGRVDRMEVVRQEMPLSMAWCLECHRDPSPHLRPKELVTKLDWRPAGDARELGLDLQQHLRIQPGTDCSICHR